MRKRAGSAGGCGGFLGPFFPFMPDAFDRHFGECIGYRSAERGGRGVESEIVTGGELHSAQNAKGVLAESGAGVPETAGAQVRLAAMGVDEALIEWVPSDGVEREIAPRGRVGVAEQRVGLDLEAAVAGAGLGFAAGQGDVVFGAGGEAELDHPKTSANDIGRSHRVQHPEKIIEGGATDLDVQVFGFQV